MENKWNDNGINLVYTEKGQILVEYFAHNGNWHGISKNFDRHDSGLNCVMTWKNNQRHGPRIEPIYGTEN